jgi:hypothetical protein
MVISEANPNNGAIQNLYIRSLVSICNRGSCENVYGNLVTNCYISVNITFIMQKYQDVTLVLPLLHNYAIEHRDDIGLCDTSSIASDVL